MKHARHPAIGIIATTILFTLSASMHAQELTADYPLIDDLADATGNNGDMMLFGNPTPPQPPSAGMPVCTNGTYVGLQGGQDIQSPVLNDFDLEDFQALVEFNITALPPSNSPRMPILMGGNLARWIGLYVDTDGNVGIKHNNFNYIWTSFQVTTDTWYEGELNYSYGWIQVSIDGQLVLEEFVGPLVDFQGDHNFMVTDYSEGRALWGCVRNLLIVSSDDRVFLGNFE